MAQTPSQLPNSAPDVENTAFDAAHPHHEARAELRDARRAGTRWRRIARWLGLAIFVFGAALLLYVFKQALDGLNYYASPARLASDYNAVVKVPSPSTSLAIQAGISVFGTALLKVLYLLILGFLASAIAARGIQFFAASEAVIDEAVLPEN
jgi:hypothetical protein